MTFTFSSFFDSPHKRYRPLASQGWPNIPLFFPERISSLRVRLVPPTKKRHPFHHSSSPKKRISIYVLLLPHGTVRKIRSSRWPVVFPSVERWINIGLLGFQSSIHSPRSTLDSARFRSFRSQSLPHSTLLPSLTVETSIVDFFWSRKYDDWLYIYMCVCVCV